MVKLQRALLLNVPFLNEGCLNLHPRYPAQRKGRGRKAKEEVQLTGEPHGETDESDPVLLSFFNELFPLCVVSV